MKKKITGFLIVLVLILLSVLIYAVQIVVFNSPRDTLFYIFQDIAFLPLQIAIVTVVLGSYLKRREKLERLKKINIVINAFFNEAGTDIIKGLIGSSKNYEKISERLNVQTDWTDKMFSKTVRYLKNADMQIEYNVVQIDSLTALMKSKRNFLIRLLENPNLLEHDTFTDMLLSVFHVMEELIARATFEVDNKADLEHLSNDIQRALKALLIEWVEYMRHLRLEYPYLYSFVVRKNLFSKKRNIYD
ncbi:hypothetical protein [Anaerotignum propionicum]|uniref:hypothetical protein n=1 Tax=Anaerotignum propionicum TaxID=28446 RepID=UPI0028A2A20F|nr:hypothetical protein [Anaerotignum propionicum]